MTVKELIKELKSFDKNSEVCIYNNTSDEYMEIIGMADEQYFEGNTVLLIKDTYFTLRIH